MPFEKVQWPNFRRGCLRMAAPGYCGMCRGFGLGQANDKVSQFGLIVASRR